MYTIVNLYQVINACISGFSLSDFPERGIFQYRLQMYEIGINFLLSKG